MTRMRRREWNQSEQSQNFIEPPPIRLSGTAAERKQKHLLVHKHLEKGHATCIIFLKWHTKSYYRVTWATNLSCSVDQITLV